MEHKSVNFEAFSCTWELILHSTKKHGMGWQSDLTFTSMSGIDNQIHIVRSVLFAVGLSSPMLYVLPSLQGAI